MCIRDSDKYYTPATTMKKDGMFDFLNDDKILRERANIEAKGDYQEEKRILANSGKKNDNATKRSASNDPLNPNDATTKE